MGDTVSNSSKDVGRSLEELFNSVREVADKHYRTGTSREALDKIINSAFDAIMQKIENGEEAELPNLEELFADLEKVD